MTKEHVSIWAWLCSKIFVLGKRNAEGIGTLPKAETKIILFLKDNSSHQQLDWLSLQSLKKTSPAKA